MLATDSQVKRGGRRTCLIVFIALAVLGSAAGLGAAAMLIFQGSSEVAEMGPWPGREVDPAQVVTVDLENLGLQRSRLQDARSTNRWSEGGYSAGAIAVYGVDAEERLMIAALRYSVGEAAAQDFYGLAEWAKEDCRWSTSANWGNQGAIHCGLPGAHDQVLWSDYWIVEIVAVDGEQLPAQDLADRVRDALAADWQAGRASQR